VKYTFGDSDLARERMRLVAEAFAPPTRALLRDIPPGDRRYVIDLGCGPGDSTALLLERFPHAFVTGIDGSEAMVTEARERVPGAQFMVGDVTEPVRLPAQLMYARMLLGHLSDQAAALAHWAGALRARGGLLVCEEPVRYSSELEVFARYERAVTEVVAASGGTLWASAALDVSPPGWERALDRVVQHPVPAARAAAMFWRNAVVWGGAPDLIDELRALDSNEDVMWELRQTVWVKNPG
jgi:trans-aconitate 2-methyltransferase